MATQAAEVKGGGAKFDRDKFLVNQRRMSFKEKYYVYDESGGELFYVERPFRFLGKRTVTIYEDDAGREAVLKLTQEHYWEIWRREYMVETPDGQLVARLSRNNVQSLFRRGWKIAGPDGTPIAKVQEDSVPLAIIRRVVDWIPFVALAGLLIKTDFDFIGTGAPGNERKLGSFNRKVSMFDKYVLDMSPDPERVIDRRVALAAGVLLDTAEKR